MRHKILILSFLLLVLAASFSISAFAGSRAYTGYLADNLCVESGVAADGADMATNPGDHTVGCALMKPCIESGYTLLIENSSGTFDSLPLDDKGNRKAVRYLKKLERAGKEDNILVSISGTVRDNKLQVERIEDAM